MPTDGRHERPLTSRPHGHILTNMNIWSHDGQWVTYDVRSDPAGSIFDGDRIERVHVESGEVEVLYQSRNGACVGVATCSPIDDRVLFIHGPENPTPDWSYDITHRQGVIVAISHGTIENLDARDLVPPFTPGALRGGSHVHIFDSRGEWVAFTYDDHVLAQRNLNRRNVGVSVPVPVYVGDGHSRNHDGAQFSVLITRTVAKPRAGSDEIGKAFEDSWVGVDGYLKPDGTRQRRAIAFQGQVITNSGQAISEVFIVDLPDDVTVEGDGPLAGTETEMPFPPRGAIQRRLTYTADRAFPGIQGARHWLRSSPDGSRIAFLMKDDFGIVQLWMISPNGGNPWQLTNYPGSIASAFTWSPDGQWIAHILDNSVFVTDSSTGEGTRLTQRFDPASAPRPEACVFSPDGARIAYVRPISSGGTVHNQILVVDVNRSLAPG